MLLIAHDLHILIQALCAAFQVSGIRNSMIFWVAFDMHLYKMSELVTKRACPGPAAASIAGNGAELKTPRQKTSCMNIDKQQETCHRVRSYLEPCFALAAQR